MSIAKVLVSMAIAVSACAGVAAPASADANPAGPDPNPFGTLSCDCQKTAPPDSPAATNEIDRGIRSGLSAAAPGLPAPARPAQRRP